MVRHNKAHGSSITLALQGGGAHGAFTWGVLDRLLEQPGCHIAGTSAPSSGAMNAAALTQGLAAAGRRRHTSVTDRLLGDARLPPCGLELVGRCRRHVAGTHDALADIAP